jgi:hypothetical protein
MAGHRAAAAAAAAVAAAAAAATGQRPTSTQEEAAASVPQDGVRHGPSPVQHGAWATNAPRTGCTSNVPARHAVSRLFVPPERLFER